MFVLQMYLRDAKQAEVLLNQQENFLSKEEVPVCIVVFYSTNAGFLKSWLHIPYCMHFHAYESDLFLTYFILLYKYCIFLK